MTTRREVLTGVGAAAALAVIGAPAVASVGQVAPAIKPLPAWDVGAGEMDWQVVFAETQDEAKRIWYADKHGYEADDPCECGCGAASFKCERFGEGLPEARRAPHWDNPDNAEPTISEMYLAGWTTCCDRCGNEYNRDDCESDVLDDKIVCHDCMTDDELRTAQPEHRRFDNDDEILST